MVNQSKANDSRFWKKWNDAGAVGSLYSGSRTYGDLVSSGALKDLDTQQKAALRDNMHAYEGKKYYGRQAQFIIDFLKHPEDFTPTEHSLRSAYVDFVVRRFDDKLMPDGRFIIFPTDITTDEIDWNRLRDVEVKVEHGYSNLLGVKAAVVAIYGTARKDQSSPWEQMRSGGVAFCLDNFVQRK